MSHPTVGVYTIGQTPRPDLTQVLSSRFPSVQFEIVGALDDLADDEIPESVASEYPLETRLRNGTRVVVDASFLEPRLQELIRQLDSRVVAHLVLCAGPFPRLSADRPLIRPFEVSVEELNKRGLTSLAVVVPFESQGPPSARKWVSAGFSCGTHAMSSVTPERPVARWVAERLAAADADTLVFDYVGLPLSLVEEVAGAIDRPVFDLGAIAMDRLEEILHSI